MSRLAFWLAAVFVADRLLKLLAVARFMKCNWPAGLKAAPTVSVVSPITRGASGLADNLDARVSLVCPSPVEHLLVCDAGDHESVAAADQLGNAVPSVRIIALESSGGPASKIEKLNAAIAQATGEVIVFVDDDIRLRPDALSFLLPPLDDPRVGVTFGLACSTGWSNTATSLMSAFVNLNAAISYLPLTFLIEPFTVTGHCFAIRRNTLDEVGGFLGMANRLDDDHEIARRLRAHGYRIVQTALVYDVLNELPTMSTLLNQLHRWFLFPRQAVAPYLARREAVATAVTSLGGLILPMLALGAIAGSRTAMGALTVSLAVVVGGQAWIDRWVLRRATPPDRWPLVAVMAAAGPALVLVSLARGDEVTWRGQRIRVRRGGWYEVVG
ncbi:MAG: glycosyltransferase [Dehalococcoidia bacterium]